MRALATKPKLLLLDEPAAGMNPSETSELMDTIREIRDRFQIAVFLIEHDMSLAMGQSPNYINNIENKKSLPSMQMFLYICEFLGVEPKEFFEDEVPMRDQLRVEREQLELKRLHLQHKMSKLPDMIPLSALDNAIEGGIITLDGHRYKQLFIPLEE